jgi:hypothetical protein
MECHRIGTMHRIEEKPQESRQSHKYQYKMLVFSVSSLHSIHTNTTPDNIHDSNDGSRPISFGNSRTAPVLSV